MIKIKKKFIFALILAVASLMFFVSPVRAVVERRTLQVGDDLSGKTLYFDSTLLQGGSEFGGMIDIITFSRGDKIELYDDDYIKVSFIPFDYNASTNPNKVEFVDNTSGSLTMQSFLLPNVGTVSNVDTTIEGGMDGSSPLTIFNSIKSDFEVAGDITPPTYNYQTTNYYIQYDAEYTNATIIDDFTLVDDDGTPLEFTIIEDTYQPNIGVIGNYHLILTGQDAAGNIAEITINLIVDDYIGSVLTPKDPLPNLDDYNSTTIVDLRSMLLDGSLYYEQNNAFFGTVFNVSDSYCDSPEHVAHPVDFYPWVVDEVVINNSSSSYGTIDISGRYIDCRNNETSYTVTLNWGDSSVPVISQKDPNYTIDINNVNVADILLAENSLTWFKAHFSVTDTYCTSEGHVDDFVYDLTFADANNTVLITGFITDCNGNKTYVDEAVPYGDFSAPIYTGALLIVKSRGAIVTINDLVGEITPKVTDLSAVTLTVILDTYTGNGMTVGDYALKITAKDASNNSAEYQFTIRVVDDLAPHFVYDGTIYIDNNDNLTKEQIVSILKKVGMLPNVQMAVTFDSAYFADPSAVADYPVELDYSSPTGQTGTVSFLLSVVTDTGEAVIIPEENFWTKLDAWFKAWWPLFVFIPLGIFALVVIWNFSKKGGGRPKYSYHKRW